MSTIDQKIPNRDHIYPKLANASEPGFVRDLLGNSIGHQLPQFVLVSGDVVELTQHAEMMYQFLPHGGASTFVIIEDDASYRHFFTCIYIVCVCVYDLFARVYRENQWRFSMDTTLMIVSKTCAANLRDNVCLQRVGLHSSIWNQLLRRFHVRVCIYM